MGVGMGGAKGGGVAEMNERAKEISNGWWSRWRWMMTRGRGRGCWRWRWRWWSGDSHGGRGFLAWRVCWGWD